MKRTGFSRQLKPKPCRVCKAQFAPSVSAQVVCSPKCALVLAKTKAEKKAARQAKESRRAQREYTRKRKDALKSRGQWIKEAQAAFNAWVRERDYGRPCISCGGTPTDDGMITGSRIDAGHYRSRGAMPQLRFEPLNCHSQCVKCNRFGSGMATEYRIGLIRRIGQEAVDWLEGPHPPKKYTIDDLREIKSTYAKLARELKKQRESVESNDTQTAIRQRSNMRN